MTTMIDFPDLDAAIDAEAWQWLQEAAPVYADAVTAEVKRGHEPGDIRRRFMRLTQPVSYTHLTLPTSDLV